MRFNAGDHVPQISDQQAIVKTDAGIRVGLRLAFPNQVQDESQLGGKARQRTLFRCRYTLQDDSRMHRLQLNDVQGIG